MYTKLGEEKTLERDASNLTHPRTRASRAHDNRHHGANGASMIDRVVASSRVVSRRPRVARTGERVRERAFFCLGGAVRLTDDASPVALVVARRKPS